MKLAGIPRRLAAVIAELPERNVAGVLLTAGASTAGLPRWRHYRHDKRLGICGRGSELMRLGLSGMAIVGITQARRLQGAGFRLVEDPTRSRTGDPKNGNAPWSDIQGGNSDP